CAPQSMGPVVMVLARSTMEPASFSAQALEDVRRSVRSPPRNAEGRCCRTGPDLHLRWWRGQDLNLRPSGYEPDELPDCSTPRRSKQCTHVARSNQVRVGQGAVEKLAGPSACSPRTASYGSRRST